MPYMHTNHTPLASVVSPIGKLERDSSPDATRWIVDESTAEVAAYRTILGRQCLMCIRTGVKCIRNANYRGSTVIGFQRKGTLMFLRPDAPCRSRRFGHVG